VSDEKAKAIGPCLVNVMRRVGAIGKGQENKFDHYKFRGIDDVFNALQPALIESGVVVLPELTHHERGTMTTAKGDAYQLVTVVVRYTFLAIEDGSSVATVVIGEGSDRGDKAFNKAMSSAFKSAMFQTFCIPTEGGQQDSETDSPEFVSRKPVPPHIADNPFDARTPKPKAKAPEKVDRDTGEVREFVYPRGAQRPEEPKWKKWRDDELKSGKMQGKTWGEIAQGSHGGQRYQWARSIMAFDQAKPDTQLRAANCVYEIEQRWYSENEGEFYSVPTDAEGFSPGSAEEF